VQKGAAGTLVTLRIKEKLDKTDYARFVPMVESQMQSGAPLRLLIELHDFKGWTAGALWEDTKFAAKHFNDIDRIAVVGESPWQHGVTLFFKPFTGAEVRYFDMVAVNEARRWIRAA
jgi:hypothetical protein